MGEAAVRPVSPGILPYLVPREDSFLAASPGVPRLGLSGIPFAQLTGLAKDRSTGTPDPTGPTPIAATLLTAGRRSSTLGIPSSGAFFL